MSVSGVVVIIVEIQGLPATIMLFKVNVSSNIHHRRQISKPLIAGVCAMAAILFCPFTRAVGCYKYIHVLHNGHHCDTDNILMICWKNGTVFKSYWQCDATEICTSKL